MTSNTVFRRIISISIFIILFILITFINFGLLIPLFIIDSVFKTSLSRAILFFWIYFFSEIFAIFASFPIYLLKSVFKISNQKYIYINFFFQKYWALYLFKSLKYLFKLKISLQGEEIVKNGNFILISRHSSIADTLLGAVFVSYPNEIILRYVLKSELLWDPAIDIYGNRLKNIFINRKEIDFKKSQSDLENLMKDLNSKDGILIYPEGTRFTVNKRKKLIEKFTNNQNKLMLEKTTKLKNLLPPRMRGVKTLIQSATSKPDLVFCFHEGLDEIVKLKDLLFGRIYNKQITIKFWRISNEHVSKDDKSIDELIYKQWQIMDSMIKNIQS